MIATYLAAGLAGLLVLALWTIAHLWRRVAALSHANVDHETMLLWYRRRLIENCSRITNMTTASSEREQLIAELSEALVNTQSEVASYARQLHHANRALILYSAGAGLAVYSPDWRN